MVTASITTLIGLLLLVWSADRFVEGSAAAARHLRVPPLLIGMVIVGFGTSMPEMTVSALAASQGNPGIALGNAYGSNITNIALILGITAIICPISVHSAVLRKELPILTVVTGLAAYQLMDDRVTRTDGVILLLVFAGLIAWTIWQGMRQKRDALGVEMTEQLEEHTMPMRRAVLWAVIGLVVLVASSRLMVWGAVTIARHLGVSDLLIGLTVVAVGTSLPELASSVISAWKGKHDIALGNIIGSNLFNTLTVVGVAGCIHPLAVGREVFTRDILVMCLLTLSLFVFGYGFRGPGRINRLEGALLISSYVAYTTYLAMGIAGG